jgi:high-affinity K+ transport system ATPase subunit B
VAPADDKPDPVRATLVAVLQQLNRAESMNEGRARDQALELREVERLLTRFWAVEQDSVKIPVVLGLLLRNGMIEVKTGEAAPDDGAPRVRYHITAPGKAFLVEAQEKSDRIA